MGIAKEVYNDLLKTIFWENYINEDGFVPETGFCLNTAKNLGIEGLYMIGIRKSPNYGLAFLKGNGREGVMLFEPKECENRNCKRFQVCDRVDGGAIMFEANDSIILAVGGTVIEEKGCKTYAVVGSLEDIEEDSGRIFEWRSEPVHISVVLNGEEINYLANKYSLPFLLGEAGKTAMKMYQLLHDSICCPI